LFWTFDYVLRETTTRWIFRSDDDVLINVEILGSFMQEMEQKYDPLTEIVIQGDCVTNGAFYPQGGGGVLFSRRAIEELKPLGHFSIWGVREACPDQRLGRLMGRLNIPRDRCSNSAFLGQPLEDDDRQRILQGNFRGLATCPAMNCVNRHCNEIVRPTRQLVFYHVGSGLSVLGDEFTARVKMATTLWNGPKELAVMERGDSERHLCWQSSALIPNASFVLL
jgi:hypothetical protein